MQLKFLTIALTCITLTACTNTDFSFGNPEQSEVNEPHNVWGNTYENQKLNPYLPLSENDKPTEDLNKKETLKIVQPKKLKLEQVAQPAPNTPAPSPAQEISPPAPTTPAVANSNWQPNEALLIRSNEVLAGLQKELGKRPTLDQMQKRLQTHMGLSVAQSQQLIVALGM